MPSVLQCRHDVLWRDTVLCQRARIVAHSSHRLSPLSPHLGIIDILRKSHNQSKKRRATPNKTHLVIFVLLIASIGKLYQQRFLAARQLCPVEYLYDLFTLLFRFHSCKTDTFWTAQRIPQYPGRDHLSVFSQKVVQIGFFVSVR